MNAARESWEIGLKTPSKAAVAALRRRLGSFVAAGTVAVVCLAAMLANASESWLTGAALQKQLIQRVNVTWSENPLRQALANLSRAQKVAIVLDRRVDPGQKVNLSANDMPLESVLRTIATKCDLASVPFGSILYFGPTDAAARLTTLTALREKDVRRLPLAPMRVFQRQDGMAWDDLAEPRSLLTELARENGFRIDGLDQLPHDLWPAAALPPMSLVDRLTLITSQFDLTFKISTNGRSLRLAPIPDDIEDRQRILASPMTATQPARKSSKSAAAQRSTPRTRPQTPATPLEKTLPRGSADAFGALRIERMSVKDEPLEAVLRQLADRLKFELRIDETAVADARVSLRQRISVTAEHVSLDELLGKLLQSTGLTFRRAGKVVEITPEG